METSTYSRAIPSLKFGAAGFDLPRVHLCISQEIVDFQWARSLPRKYVRRKGPAFNLPRKMIKWLRIDLAKPEAIALEQSA